MGVRSYLPQAVDLPKDVQAAMLRDAMEAARQKKAAKQKAKIVTPNYAQDPVGYVNDVLNVRLAPDVQDIARSVLENPVTIAKSANSTGKSHGAAHLAVWFFECFQGAQVYTAAAPPEDNLKIMLWGKIGELTMQQPNIFHRYKVSLAGMRIERSPDQFIAGVTVPASGKREERIARFSGKHAPALLFIVDEGDAVPPEVYEGIESCMTGGFTRLLILFNPRSKSGPVYRKEYAGQGNVITLTAFNHPNVRTGLNLIPGAVDRNTTVRRVVEWSRPLAPDEEPDSQCFEVPDFLVGFRATERGKGNSLYEPLPAGWRKVTDNQLSYMVLAEYPPQGSQQLISEEWIARARSNYDLYVAKYGEVPPRHTVGIGGHDVADQGDDSNCFCRRYGNWVAPLVTWQGVDLENTGDKIASLYLEHNVDWLFVDATGVGAGVAPHARREVRKRKATAMARRIVPVMVGNKPTKESELGKFGCIRDQLWWALREWLKNEPNAMLPPDEGLVQELLNATYEVTLKVVKVLDKKSMKATLGRSPDRADALMMTFSPQRIPFQIGLV